MRFKSPFYDANFVATHRPVPPPGSLRSYRRRKSLDDIIEEITLEKEIEFHVRDLLSQLPGSSTQKRTALKKILEGKIPRVTAA